MTILYLLWKYRILKDGFHIRMTPWSFSGSKISLDTECLYVAFLHALFREYKDCYLFPYHLKLFNWFHWGLMMYLLSLGHYWSI